MKSPFTITEPPKVAVPEALPIFNVSPAPAKLTVVAVVFNRSKLVLVVVRLVVTAGLVNVLLVSVCVFASNTKVSPTPSAAIAPVVGIFTTVSREFFMVLDDITGAEIVGPVARTKPPVLPVVSLSFAASSALLAEPNSDILKLYVVPKAIVAPLIVIFGFSS